MILSKTSSFTADIEHLCREKRMSYIDAVIHWCDTNDVDPEIAGQLIRKDPTLKARIELEAQDLNMVEKTSRLPL